MDIELQYVSLREDLEKLFTKVDALQSWLAVVEFRALYYQQDMSYLDAHTELSEALQDIHKYIENMLGREEIPCQSVTLPLLSQDT